jgi:ATP-dependent DNA helicase RecG
MNQKTPRTVKELNKLVKQGESANLEFKRSTGELREGLQTLCAFLNRSGGMVLFGVRPDGNPEGQQIADKTLREIAQALDRFEPIPNVQIERISLGNGREILILRVESKLDSILFTFDGRAFMRVSSTTRKMTQEQYEALLLKRNHRRQTWENQDDDEITIRDIDRDEVFRIINISRSLGRLFGPAGRNLADALDRLGLRMNGQILRAAVVLFGKTFLPYYPQCELRMARFRGTDKTEFLDQRQIRGPAFKLLEEAELFCQRHFPMPAKIVPTQMRRVETPLIPPDAMREILVNAFIHRDYSVAGGAISLAIFDDRVEIWSAGGFPKGITPKMLEGSHPSVQRNPIIADVFHRTGLIEKWGRGTNRVAEMCLAGGIQPPMFEEIGSFALVTFKVQVGMTSQVTPQDGAEEAPSRHHVGTKSELSHNHVKILESCMTEKTLLELMKVVGRKDRTKFRVQLIYPLITAGLLKMTVPDRPNSRLQKYRLTAAGEDIIKKRGI